MTNSHLKKFNLTKSNQNLTSRRRFNTNNHKFEPINNINSKSFRSDLSLEICSLEYSRWCINKNFNVLFFIFKCFFNYFCFQKRKAFFFKIFRN